MLPLGPTQVTEYLDARGRSPFRNWVNALDSTARVKVVTAIARLERGNFAHVKNVGRGVLERKVNFGPGLRIYLALDGDRIILLLGGGTKRRAACLAGLQAAKGKRRERAMALTRDFRETVMENVRRDPKFRRGLLVEAANCLLSGEPDVAKTLLRDYINATIGFKALAQRLQKNPKGLHQMLGPNGNPSLNNLTLILSALQESEEIRLEVAAKRKGREQI